MKALLCKLFGWYCVQAPVVEIPKPQPMPDAVVISDPLQMEREIEDIALKSKCMNVVWKDRGRAPKGYVVGVAKTFVQTKCDKDLSVKLSAPHHSLDALARMGVAPNLPNVFTVLIGLGMRESTGKHCEGKDMSANFNTASTCEAGAWQTSYNAVDLKAGLKDFVWNWKKKCFLEDFKQGVSCSASSWKYWGNTQEPGYKFQKMAKECPAFHAEFTALVMRTNYKHYGPMIRREVEFKQECLDMFKAIDEVVECK